ncbi:MAG: T9SS type A sorting domain-containing protein [Candidatus Kapabacteria bacterium]|nr:T9SS type A sorting domain-containing protein [Candidatus Kapabacteria bacterium]
MKYIAILFCTLVLILSVSFAQTTIKWNNSFDLNISSNGNEYPRIVVDGKGYPQIIWHQTNRCMFTHWDGKTFTTPKMLNPGAVNVAGGSWMGPDIACRGDNIYVVFKQLPEDQSTSHIYCVSSFDGGVTFSSPVQVENIGTCISRFPTITIDDFGNPIVAFMKFDAGFKNARWVVSKSIDFGFTFFIDVLASGWSSGTSTVCDCCPGTICATGKTVAMLYRDNNANIRDSWAGISKDSGNSFASGMNIDKLNWSINYCPASGPDGVIIGDTLYSAFMSGGSGKTMVYSSKAALKDMTGAIAQTLTGNISGLSVQNYPRIAADGNAMAIVWKQIVNGADQCLLRFTSDVSNGFPTAYDTVDIGNITTVDVAIGKSAVYVVWEDDITKTVKMRSGLFSSKSVPPEEKNSFEVSVYPNPSNSKINISSNNIIDNLEITNLYGEKIYQAQCNENNITLFLETSGVYFMKIKSKGEIILRKVLISN